MSKKFNVDNSTKAYFVGGGLASLAGAFFLIRDGKMEPKDITIYEQLNINGGSCDGSGNAKEGYMIRGGRMINYEHYSAVLDLYRFIPSLTDPKTSVTDEIRKFSSDTATCSTARLIDEDHEIVKNVDKLGFNNADRMAMIKLMLADEDVLGPVRIDQLFSPHFFETNFWYMWATTFAFQPWHSAFEFKRYAHAFINEM
ncbi:MAG: oleate hydratase, partial [Clostridium perfringens]|nr:oleate hydratase [Clostridium perfringens]